MGKYKLFLPLLIIILSLFCGCNHLESKEPENYVERLEPTPEQQEIIDLISNDAEFLFFEYKTEVEYSSVEFWVEVYKNGELTDRPSGIHASSNNIKARQGKVSVMITKKPGYQWTFAVSDGEGGKISHTSETSSFDYGAMASGSDVSFEAYAIENGKEIALHATQFSSGNILRSLDPQMYLEEPEYLKSSDYVHLIKCKFTK